MRRGRERRQQQQQQVQEKRRERQRQQQACWMSCHVFVLDLLWRVCCHCLERVLLPFCVVRDSARSAAASRSDRRIQQQQWAHSSLHV